VGRSIAGDKSLPTDLVESFFFPFPPSYYGGEDVIPEAQEYFEKMLTILVVLHKITAAALNVTFDYFNSHYNPLDSALLAKEITGFYLRFAHYPPIDSSEVDDEAERYGAHTDYECYTILKPDANDWKGEGAGGLQVQLGSGEFVPVSGKRLRSYLSLSSSERLVCAHSSG
jgi:isopenicillin N synthase-like dioxygenase